MLSAQEALLLKAAYDEQEAIQQQNTAGLLGAAGGGVLGVAAGTIPHKNGNAVNSLKKGHQVNKFKPGMRMTGGVAGALVGGLLGGGVAAVMKQESAAARGMAQLQAGGDINEYEMKQIEDEIAAVYSNPSRYM